ncbi:acetylgalactosaminyl-O-glycosyl-glycoprotein beta-1,3-N-acetylglucosaminyltransferase [Lutra lutra]|uniref:acetylgalactosaminyl-O-glycosyl-glycoprotein beta-1,3-N-acetylglucosaminyltransferase n=1 Tax=Lutra lutra TaxID=9657 RepID=UPI001FD1028D|nr:acetylgalactosaminyl-O-glycosyl-glycoprotein beta-1,3-N-acetylglucosaminyltransferase [Lutra lutra]XP_047546231.1 acetylgalactosaminyl-O-glycosyl-glycoprotein beta-1,3-N-acetylglucosaminyltransferase [Lutra lutra]
MLQRAFGHTFLSPTLQHLLYCPAERRPRARFRLSRGDDVSAHTADVLRFLQTRQPGRPLLAGQLLARSVPVRDGCSKSFAPPRLYSRQTYRLPSPARGSPPQPALPHRDAYRGTCLKRASRRPAVLLPPLPAPRAAACAPLCAL